MNITNSKVYPLDNNLVLEGSNENCICRAWRSLFSSTIKESVAEVYEKISLKNARREAEIEKIVVDGVCTGSLWNILWQIAGIVLGGLGVFIGFVFWPTDNVFMEPQKWYQCVLQCGFVWIGQYTQVISIQFGHE